MAELNVPSLKDKKILITGGCGFIGSNLARRLTRNGANVSIFIRPGKSRKLIKDIEDQIEIIEGDLRNPEDVENSIKNKDIIFHLAWQTDLKKSMVYPSNDLNNDGFGTLNILESCKKENPEIKIVFPSTTTVVGINNKIPSNENEKVKPLAIYEVHKTLGEEYMFMYYNTYGLNTTVLRLSNAFGEGQRIDNPNRGILNFMVGKALRGEELTVYGDGKFIRDYCYVQNYLDAFIIAATSEKTKGELFVLGSGKGKTFKEVVEKIKEITEEITKKEVKISYLPFPEGENKINKRNFIADYDKFHKATGWFPRINFDEALRNTITYYHGQVHN